MDQNIDLSAVLALVAAVVLIVFTGYLIINNIFRIAVANDVRFYGLLKTIGTTGRQIKRIILLQAGMLSLVGIPIGIGVGYFLGLMITWVVVPNMDFMDRVSSMNPLIFVGPLFCLGYGISVLRQTAPDGGKGISDRGAAVYGRLSGQEEGSESQGRSFYPEDGVGQSGQKQE